VDDLTPSDALRAIADHLEKHPQHGPVSVYLSGVASTPNLAAVLDGATAADITLGEVDSPYPNVRRDFGPVNLCAIVGRDLLTQERTTVTRQVLTATELLARTNQLTIEDPR
jgi:hypothetical protein